MWTSGILIAGVNAVAVAIALAVAALCRKRQRLPGTVPMSVMMTGVAWWLLCYIPAGTLPSLDARVWCARLAYLGIFLAVGGYLVFALEYVSHRRRSISFFNKMLLPPVLVSLALIFSDPWHHRFYTRTSWAPQLHIVYYQHGPAYWAVLAFIYSVILVSSGLLVYAIANFPRRYWKTTALMLAGVTAPICTNLAYNFGLLPRGVDVTPIGLIITGVGLYIGVVHGRAFDVTPVAQHTLFERMSEGMLVFDMHGRLIDFNRAAGMMVGITFQIGMKMDSLPSPWREAARDLESTAGETQVGTGSPVSRWYEVGMSVLRDARDKLDGRLLLIREITDRKKLEERLKNLALHDALTGLYNRHYLDVTVAHDVARCRRQNGALSVVMFDLDQFKLINDRYGHQVGDLVLRTFGQFLATYTRRSDFVCRYGGEEFVLVLPETSLEDAMKSANEWRERFASLAISLDDFSSIHVTFSGGVAAFPAHGVSSEALIRAADAALYRAKRAGRNCILAATAPADS